MLLTIIVPKSQEIARTQLRSSDVDYFEGLIKSKKFNDTVKGLTVYADDKNSKNEFINIYIKKTSPNDKFQITFAKKGIFWKKGNAKILVLYDGQTLSSNKGKITNFYFSKSDFGLAEMDSHLIVHKKLQEQPTKGLIDCVKKIYFKQNKKILNCDQKILETYTGAVWKNCNTFLPAIINFNCITKYFNIKRKYQIFEK